MLEIIKYAKRLVKEGKVKRIGKPGKMGQLYEVGNHSPRIFTKPGRNVTSCDCFNGTLWCNEGICVHKIAMLLYESDNNFLKKIDKVIKDYEFYEKSKLPLKWFRIIEDLKSLRVAR